MTETHWTKEHGSAMRERRRRLGLTQEELAEQAGVSVRTVSTLEQGDREPHISTIRLMAEALECHPDDLLDKRVHPPSSPRAVRGIDGHRGTSGPESSAGPALAEEPRLEILPASGVPARQRHARWLAVGGAAVITLVLLGLGIWAILPRSPALDPDLVAVAIFENRTGDPALDHVGQAASEWIAQNLSESGVAKAVTSATVFRGAPAHEENGRAADTKEAILAIARTAEAAVVVTGAFSLEGDALRMAAWIDDVHGDALIYAVPSVIGPRTEPTALIESLGDRALGALAAHYDFFVPRPSLVPPPTFAAYRELEAGIDCWRSLLSSGSGPPVDRVELVRELLERMQRATEIDSNFLTPRSFIFAFHYFVRRDFEAAEACVSEITRSREQLSPWKALRAERWSAMLAGDSRKSLRLLRAMAELDPHSMHVQNWIGMVAGSLRRPREALEAFAKIDESVWRDPLIGRNYLLWQTVMYHDLGEHERELEAVQLFEEYYPDDWFAMAQSRINVMVALGRIEDMHQVIDECMQLPRDSVGWPESHLRGAVVELRAAGYPEDAAIVAERAVRFCQNRPQTEADSPQYLPTLAECFYFDERWEDAQAIYERLASSEPEQIRYHGRLGTLAARRGDRTTALRIQEELKKLERPYVFGEHTNWCARIAALLGKREDAVRLLREAESQGARGLHIYPDIDLEPLYGYPPYEELRRPKGLSSRISISAWASLDPTSSSSLTRSSGKIHPPPARVGD